MAEEDITQQAPPAEPGAARVQTLDTAVKAMQGAAGENSIDIWTSRQEVDRQDEVLVAAGCRLDDYLRNPVVLWAHDQSVPPIAKSLSTQPVVGQGVLSTWLFADTPFAQEVGGLYRGGFLSAASAGFRPLAKMQPMQTADGRGYWQCDAWELLEQSAVSVPANGLALAKAFTLGSDVARGLLADLYPDLWGNPSADPQEQLARVKQTEAERIAADLRRVEKGAESLRNIARHQRKGGDLTFDPAPLAGAVASIAEVLGSEFTLKALGLADTVEPHPPAAPEPTQPPAAEPHPPAAAPGESDLPAEVLSAITEVATDLRSEMRGLRDDLRDDHERRRKLAKALIGRRVPIIGE